MKLVMFVVLMSIAACGGQKNPDQCGDGDLDQELDEYFEECDGTSGLQMECQTCTSACTIDRSACGPCGNGVREDPEQCDTSDFGMSSCTSLGFEGGELACTATCERDTSGCTGAAGVTVQVRVNGVPHAGAPVAIADATGASVASLVTDAQGQVTHVIGNDHRVTAAHTHASGDKEMQTFEDVDPGDTVVIEFTEVPSTPIVVLGKTNTTFPAVPGATTHRSTNGCLQKTTSASSGEAHLQNVFPTCVDAQQEASVFAEVYDGNGAALGYKFCGDLALSTTTPTDCAIAALDTAYADMACGVTGVQAGTQDIQFTYSVGMGTVTHNPFAQLIVDPTAGQDYVRATPLPNAAFVQRASCTAALDSADFEGSRRCTATLAAPGAASFAGTDFPTAIPTATFDSADPSRPGLSWTEGPASGAPDATTLTIYLFKTGESMTWTLTGPGSTSSPMHVPALPADAMFAPYQPNQFTPLITSTSVSKVDYVSVTSYEQLLAEPASTAPPNQVCSSSRYAQ